MDLRQLDYFVHVAELGSFSRAASMLSIAQSALSHRVRQLEVELKQPLLYRNGRGVVPTDAGKRLLVHARGILMQVNRSREELEDLRGAPAGHADLGAADDAVVVGILLGDMRHPGHLARYDDIVVEQRRVPAAVGLYRLATGKHEPVRGAPVYARRDRGLVQLQVARDIEQHV